MRGGMGNNLETEMVCGVDLVPRNTDAPGRPFIGGAARHRAAASPQSVEVGPGLLGAAPADRSARAEVRSGAAAAISFPARADPCRCGLVSAPEGC